MTVPLPVINNTFRCTFRWVSSAVGVNAVNVIHVQALNPPLSPSQVYTVLNTFVTAAMWGTVGNSSSIANVDIIPLDGTSSTYTFATGSPAKWGGGSTGDVVPVQCTLIKLQTGLRGRNHRGRIYLPFLAES